MSRWNKLATARPPAEDKYLVYCRSSCGLVPFFSTAWYNPATGRWTEIDGYWAAMITHWAELRAPEVVI